MRRELIKFIEDGCPLLDGRVFTFPAPASVGYPFALLSLIRMAPSEERLSEDGVQDWSWQLTIYGERLADLDPICKSAMDTINRPGERFVWGDYRIEYLRFAEMGDIIMQEDQDSVKMVSGIVIKFTLLSVKD